MSGEVDAPHRPDRSGWAPYLDPDEELLWEGAPQPGLRFRASDIPLTLFGCVFAGFALFWMAMALVLGGGSGIVGIVFPLFGLPFLAVGAYLAVGRFFWEAYVRSKTRYALTDKRGFIAKSAMGRELKSYPIDAATEIDYRPGPAATIFFVEEERIGNKGRRYTAKHGFEYISDGDAVYRLMRDVQQGTLEKLGED